MGKKLLKLGEWPHFEAVRLATLAGGLLRLSRVHKPGRLELLNMIAHFAAIRIQTNDMHQRPEAILYSGDQGHSSLHQVAECVLPKALHNEIVQAFAAGLNCAGHVVGLE